MAAAKKNFFKDHYDWLVALVGLALLGGVGFLFVSSLENTPDDARAACAAELEARKSQHKAVPVEKTVNDTLKDVQREFESPPRLEVPNDKKGSFLASECRVYCQNPDRAACHKPIPVKSEVCPFCGFTQPKEDVDVARGGADVDNDGMPDAWENKYGFKPLDAADAKQDADGDMFTNLEEYEAKTNPKDPEDHPDYLDDLQVGNLETEKLPFWFSQTEASGRDSFRAIFMATDPKYDPRTRAGAGDEISWTLRRSKTAQKEKSGWRVMKVERKFKRVKRAGAGQETEVEASVVTLQRVSDKREFPVPMNVKGFPIEEQLELQWNRGEGKTFKVAKGSAFELNKRKYEVKAIGQGSATIIDLKTNTTKTIGAGNPETKPENKSASSSKASSKPNPKPKPKR